MTVKLKFFKDRTEIGLGRVVGTPLLQWTHLNFKPLFLVGTLPVTSLRGSIMEEGQCCRPGKAGGEKTILELHKSS